MNTMVKITKCPKCGAEIDDEDDGNQLCIRQKFSTTVMGTMDGAGH